MSDELKHECGVALLRLCKPYDEHYGLQKLALLLEKQHNRGQDGAGIASLKLEADPGTPYYQVEKSNGRNPLAEVLEKVWENPFDGDLFLGHLRYGTFGNGSISACHPVIKNSACRNRTLLLAGNFNLTNSNVLFNDLTAAGHHLPDRQDTSILLHIIGHELEKMYESHQEICICELLKNAASKWDGGFLICGIFGNGTAFALRDPSGIRPGYYYHNSQLTVVASERPAIQTAFDLMGDEVCEIPPGHVLIIHKNNHFEVKPCLPQREIRRCLFERIYFSRGNDCDIQAERRRMGKFLVPQIVKAVDNDLENSFFSYIPNTAQVSFHGLLDELLHSKCIRFGQVIVKDAKFRTFISDDKQRKALGMHIYDVVHGLVRAGSDNLVVLDDSIVRGTTMKNMILKMLDRIRPKKIVVASAAPPICYPDCYGIDMARLGDLVAFQALISILKKQGRSNEFEEAVRLAREDLKKPDILMQNHLQKLYLGVNYEELIVEIANLLKPKDLKAEFQVVYQHLDDLKRACPGYTGDWYFSGNYPTPGGNRVVNQALINYADNINQRAY